MNTFKRLFKILVMKAIQVQAQMMRVKIVFVTWRVLAVKHFECPLAHLFYRQRNRRMLRKRYSLINLRLIYDQKFPHTPQTTAKNKQRRRNISPTKRNKLLTRSVMDLPTTDPGSDFLDYYTTDDECETDYDTEGNATKTITRVKKILRGDMRKTNSASYEMMPPELIITKVIKCFIVKLN